MAKFIASDASDRVVETLEITADQNFGEAQFLLQHPVFQ
jgi:hypothetical protein